MREIIATKERGVEYFTLALVAFGGLGMECLLAFWLEPMLLGFNMKALTLSQTIVHWGITCITWLLFAGYILRYSKNQLEFDLFKVNNRFTMVGVASSLFLFIIVALSNYFEYDTLKIVYEFQKYGAFKASFQHIYYFSEVILFTLIIVYGQMAMEKWFKYSKLPYGGIIVAITWGLAHTFTKGSVLIGLQTAVLGFLFGSIYLLLSRDIRKTYIVLAIAFVL